MKKPAAILLAVVCHVANAEALKPIILQCMGEQISTGIEAPKDAYVSPPDKHMHGTYTIHGK